MFGLSGKVPKQCTLIVKLALEINDIVSKNREGDSPYLLQHVGTDAALAGLLKIRSVIQEMRPHGITLVSFVTIPPVHFEKKL